MRRVFRHNVAMSAALLLILAAVPTTAPAKGAPLVGRLTTSNNRPVYLNGNKVSSGTTVVSGAELKSTEGVGATIDLAQLGSLDLAPNTHVSLSFTQGSVSVELKSGHAVLTTRRGVTGRLSTPDGKVVESDPAKESSVSGNTEPGGTPAKAGRAGMSAGKVGALGAAGAGAAAAGATLSRGRGRNPSPGTPGGRN